MCHVRVSLILPTLVEWSRFRQCRLGRLAGTCRIVPQRTDNVSRGISRRDSFSHASTMFLYTEAQKYVSTGLSFRLSAPRYAASLRKTRPLRNCKLSHFISVYRSVSCIGCIRRSILRSMIPGVCQSVCHVASHAALLCKRG